VSAQHAAELLTMLGHQMHLGVENEIERKLDQGWEAVGRR
jgi:hypothetical protein